MISKNKMLDEFEQMVNLRVANLNDAGFGPTEEFREARKIHETIRRLVEKFFYNWQPDVTIFLKDGGFVRCDHTSLTLISRMFREIRDFDKEEK